MSELILMGEIVGVHGIRGEVKIRSHSSHPQDIVRYPLMLNQPDQTILIKKSFLKNNQLVAQLEGITTRNDAEKLVGGKLYVAREHLPEPEESEFYYTDLEGLEVRNSEKTIGIIKAMHNFGAGDIMEITFNNGKSEMLPYDAKTVLEVNLKGGYMLVNLPESVMVQP